MTNYLQFIRGLDNHTFINQVRQDAIPLLPPFDSLVNDILELTDPSPEQINKAANLYLHQDDYAKLLILEPDQELALCSYKKLVDASVHDEIRQKLNYGSDIDESLNQVESILIKRKVFIPQTRAKLWDDLNEREDDVMFKFMKYNISRGKLSIVVAFSGIGKTTTSLCFANTAANAGYTTLIIALKDWSEAELKRKTANLSHKDRIGFAVYGDCSLHDIDYEISLTRPDVVIVDALTDITMPFTDTFHRTIGDIAEQLRKMAVKYDCHLFTTHQTNVLESVVLPQHFRDSKSNLIQHLDIGWGLGANGVSDTLKIVTTVKLRHQESVRPWKCVFDYTNLIIQDKGLYKEHGDRFKR